MAVPPFLRFDAERFDAFFARLPHDTAHATRIARTHDERIANDDGVPGRVDEASSRPLRHAIEIRHESFRDPAFIEMLRRHRVALVCADTVSYFDNDVKVRAPADAAALADRVARS